jgi:hypothetical protein
MEPYQVAKIIFDKLYAPHDSPENDLILADARIKLGDSYFKMENGVDYREEESRLIYLYMYVGAHASFFSEIANHLYQAQAPIFKNSTLRVACLGGGPGTDIIGLTRLLENQQSTTTVTARIYDREIGWEPIWQEVAQVIGVNPSFQAMDVCTPMSSSMLAEISTYDLITLSYLASEVVHLGAPAHAFFQSCFGAMKSGAFAIYIDNSGEHTAMFDSCVANSGLQLVFKNEVDPFKPTRVNVEARIFEPVRNKLLVAMTAKIGSLPSQQFYPKSSADLAYRVYYKS